MLENLWLYQMFVLGIAGLALGLLALLQHRSECVRTEIFVPWRIAARFRDDNYCRRFALAARQAEEDFRAFRCPPWRWFRYRNILKREPPPNARPYHQDQSIAG